MSQLITNTTTINELITLANNLPDVGSGGGTSVETCTLNLRIECYNSSKFYFIASSVDEDGNITAYSENFYLGTEESYMITINALQGSAVGIVSDNAMSMEYSMSDGAVIISGFDGGMEAVIQVGAETSANWTVGFG